MAGPKIESPRRTLEYSDLKGSRPLRQGDKPGRRGKEDNLQKVYD